MMVREWTATDRMGICHDCREMPENRHFTTVPSDSGRIIGLGPHTLELFNDSICDKCFLRRRFEGQL